MIYHKSLFSCLNILIYGNESKLKVSPYIEDEETWNVMMQQSLMFRMSQIGI